MKILSSIALVAAGLTAGAGCQVAPPTVRAVEIQPEPVIDTATEWRNWDPSVAHYASTVTIAGTTRQMFYTCESRGDELYYTPVPVPLFLGNLIAMPVTLFVTPPGTQVQHAAAQTRETFTAMPVSDDLTAYGTTRPYDGEAIPVEPGRPTPVVAPEPTQKNGEKIVPVVPLPSTAAPTPARTLTPSTPATRPAPASLVRPAPAPTTLPELNK